MFNKILIYDIIKYDCRFLGSSGIGVFLRECLIRFYSNNLSLLLIGNKTEIKKESLPISNNIEILECDINTFSLNELFFFPKYLLHHINKCDAYFTPYFNIPSGIKIPVFSTIHDMIFPDMPDLTSKIGLLARMFFYKRASRKSDLIFTVSKFSEERIMYYLPKTKKTKVIYNGLSDYIIKGISKNKFEEKKENYILYIGNIKKHKGLKSLIQGFSKALQKGLKTKLYIIGNSENFRTKDSDFDSLLTSLPQNSHFAIELHLLLKILGNLALVTEQRKYNNIFVVGMQDFFCLFSYFLHFSTRKYKKILNIFPQILYLKKSPKNYLDKMRWGGGMLKR